MQPVLEQPKAKGNQFSAGAMRRLSKPGNMCGDGHYICRFSIDRSIREGASLATISRMIRTIAAFRPYEVH
jgi:hypothetical protein